jgi:hypothetical protein
MRQCKYQVWNRATKTQEEKCGMWHKWSSDYEEFENGGCTFAVGVVENADGSVALPRADWVTFTDQPPTTGGAVANGEQQLKAEIAALLSRLPSFELGCGNWPVHFNHFIEELQQLSAI